MTAVAVKAPTDALAQRIAVVGEALGVRDGDLPEDLSLIDRLVAVVARVQRLGDESSAWLLVVGLTGALPDQPLTRAVARALALKEPEDAVRWLLDTTAPLAMRHGSATATLRLVTDRPLVDVDFTAKSGVLTGIQRVVRGVTAEWNNHHDIELVAWTAGGGSYRPLGPAERERLLHEAVAEYDPATHVPSDDGDEIVVPWGVPVILIEVPPAPLADRLAALAEFTPSSVRLVGHDCIPISSAETVGLTESDKFGRYLDLVKYADRVAGVSHSAAAEFAGFVAALQAQGLPGPEVVACPLPHTSPLSGDQDEARPSGRPLVACVGSVGRRKNQVALVEAAEMLWREGLDFEVRLLGHVEHDASAVTALVAELQRLGRPLAVESGVSDARIANTLAHARCLAFPSLHEGYGLPLVEALSHGVPVITSDFGSMQELAQGKGGLLVDPQDVHALADALRALLTDDDLHARLVAEAEARPVRTWSEYADDLWNAVVA